MPLTSSLENYLKAVSYTHLSRRLKRPAAMSLFCPFRTDTTPGWETAGTSCPAARPSASPLPEMCIRDSHGVPGGHEFTSFVLGLYNASGPGQTLDEEILSGIRSLKPAHMNILVSLSCTMCPELVLSLIHICPG